MELLYHVNEQDEILGSIGRDQAHSRGLLHRTGMIFLINGANTILLNQRSANKATFPAMYDASVSFHVSFGETYEQAAQREMWEEIGICGSPQYLNKFIHHDPPEHQMVAIFLYLSDDTPHLDSTEFTSYQFYSIHEAQALIRTEPITPWLREGWKSLKQYLSKNR